MRDACFDAWEKEVGGRTMDLDFRGKNIAVVGLATENMPLIRYLKEAGAFVCGRDMKSSDKLEDRYQALLNLGIELRLGLGYLDDLNQYDIVFLTPGIPRCLPQLAEARRKGVRFSSQMELFFNICPATIIGVTGSSGKTTTTTLIGNMLLGSGFDTRVGGNIGKVLLNEVKDMTSKTKVVLELSSFQLQDMRISPKISLLTNITPNHLDVHKDMNEYIEAKKQVYLHQNSSDAVIFNLEDPLSHDFYREANGRVYFFSKKPLPQGLSGAYIKEGWVVVRDLAASSREILVCPVEDIRLLGIHNRENVLAATLIAYLVGAKIEAIAQAIREFKGVEHRLEYVATIEGIRYYNDSIATSPARAKAGILSFNEPVILIAGGYDKKIPFDELREAVLIKRPKAVVTLGATAPKIEQELFGLVPLYRAESFEDAICTASSLASAGDCVLLSPACASFDMFASYVERGKEFRRIVLKKAEAINPQN